MAARRGGGMELPDGVRRERIEPLWTRVDRNRVKLAFFITAYLISIAVSAGIMAGAAVLVMGVLTLRSPELAWLFFGRFRDIVAVVTMAAFLFGCAWVAYAMLRSEKRLLSHLGAKLTPTGSYIRTKMVLKDMALAAGFDHAPPLWVIAECRRVNAFAVGRTSRGAVLGVTQGFVERLDDDEQRAVFANLMARLANGDVRMATAISALVGPMWRLRERDLRRDDRESSEETYKETATALSRSDASAAGGTVMYLVLYAFLIIVTEYLMLGHQRSTMLTAEKADAEGMLLLKDPRAMLDTLEKVLEADNTVPSAGEAYSSLFYCWAGFGYAPEDDPEFDRVGRLREVLGVEGLIDAPRAEDFGMPEDAFAPPAPRVDEQQGELP